MKISSGCQKIIFDDGNFSAAEIKVENQASLLYILALLAGKREKKINIKLIGNKARCEIVGIFYGQKKDDFKIDTIISCQAPLTYGKVLIKGVLTGQASCFFQGLIKIDKKALQSEGQLIQRTLLVSPDAKAQSLPYLEIYTNQTKAHHAVAISQPNEEQLVYLQSRGLTPKVSKRLITESFLTEVMGYLPKKQANRVKTKLKLYE